MIMLSRARSRFVSTICGRSRLRSYATGHDPEDRDVVIVGGGPAGLALASALGMLIVLAAAAAPRSNSPGLGSSQVARSSLRITVIDAGDFSKIENWSMDADRFSNRVSSLTNDSCRFLKGKTKPRVAPHEPPTLSLG